VALFCGLKRVAHPTQVDRSAMLKEFGDDPSASSIKSAVEDCVYLLSICCADSLAGKVPASVTCETVGAPEGTATIGIQSQRQPAE